MPIKRIGIKKYIWVKAKSERTQPTTSTTNFSHIKTGRRTIGSYQNPIQCWRKVPAGWGGNKDPKECVCDEKLNGVQEVFKDNPCVDSSGKKICSRRIRTGMLLTNEQLKDPTKKQNSINYNYKQYLQRKCKTIQQNSFNFTPNQPATQPHQFRGNCSQNTDGNCCFNGVTYKPNNKKYSKQGSVSAGERLLRLKYDSITKNGRKKADPYRGSKSIQNKIVKSKSYTDKMAGAGKRIFRSGGPRRRPRLAHRHVTDKPNLRNPPHKPLLCPPSFNECVNKGFLTVPPDVGEEGGDGSDGSAGETPRYADTITVIFNKSSEN